MRSGKKLTLGILPTFLCLLSMLVVACGGSGGTTSTQAQKAASNKQVYNVPVPLADLKTLDPALVQDAYSIQAINAVFTGLVTLDDQLKVQPQLAQNYSVGSDGLTWTFNLRSNLKFSDGTPLTSQDVVYSIDRALDPALNSAVAPSYLALVKDSDKRVNKKVSTLIGDSLMAPNPTTVVIVTNKKNAQYFLDALTYPTSYVVEKSMITKYGNNFADHLNEGIGGDGPFTVKSYQHGKQIDFAPNSNYYGPKPQLQDYRLSFYKVSDTAYRAYQSGQLSSAGVPTTDVASVKQSKDFHLVPQLWINYYTMNYLTKPFDNIKIRQAFALAVNKDLIAHNVWHDVYTSTNHIVPKGMPGYDQNLTGPDGAPTAGDTAKAKTLLQQGMQEEGYSSISQLPQITVTVATGGSADIRNEVAALQQMWQSALGVNVKIDDIDFNKLLTETIDATNNPKGIQMWGIAWIADYPDPQDWTSLQFGNGAPQNNMNYGQNKSSDAAQQQQVQQNLEAADVNTDSTARYQQYNTAEQQLINDVAWLPTTQVQAPIVRKTCVTGVIDNADGLVPPDDWGNIYISTDSNCANLTAI